MASGMASMKTEVGLQQLNDFLADRTYVGSEDSATNEDFNVYMALPASVDKAKYPHVFRWSRNLSFLRAAFPHRQWPTGTTFAGAGSKGSSTKGADAASSKQTASKAAPTGATAAPAKKEEKKKEEKKAAAKPEAVSDGAARNEEDDAAAKISLIVGKVTKVWEHPDSDKLFCEEIDCGEGAVRQIGSGLRHFYKAEEFLNRMVLVVGNLKPKKLAGFESNGMVLCASNADHTDVKFVEVPAGAKLGDRVVFGDMAMDEPAAPGPCEKKKLFAKAQPHFVSKDGVAMYKDKPFTLPAGKCTAPVADGYSLS